MGVAVALAVDVGVGVALGIGVPIAVGVGVAVADGVSDGSGTEINPSWCGQMIVIRPGRRLPRNEFVSSR